MKEIKKRALELVALLEAEHGRLPEGDRKDVLALAWYGLNLIEELETKKHPHCVIGCLSTIGEVAMRLDRSLVPQLTPDQRMALLVDTVMRRREELPEEERIAVSNAIPV